MKWLSKRNLELQSLTKIDRRINNCLKKNLCKIFCKNIWKKSKYSFSKWTNDLSSQTQSKFKILHRSSPRKCSLKNVPFRISKNSQENNTFVVSSFVACSWIPLNFPKFLRIPFSQPIAWACFRIKTKPLAKSLVFQYF